MNEATERILTAFLNLLRGFQNWVNEKIDAEVFGCVTGAVIGFLLLRFVGGVALFSFLLGVVVCIVGFVLFLNSPQD